MADTQSSALASLLTKHVSSIVGAIITSGTLLSLLTSSSLKTWVRHHSYLIFTAWVLTAAVALVVIDIILTRKRKQATSHDQRIVNEIFEAIPPRGPVISWLKDNFISKSVPVKYIDQLEAVFDNMRLNVIGLDNPDANRSYGRLRDSIECFLQATTGNLFASPDYKAMQNSPDWPWEQWKAASDEINTACNELIAAYDDFILSCHKNGLF